jgi:hypothetical protein
MCSWKQASASSRWLQHNAAAGCFAAVAAVLTFFFCETVFAGLYNEFYCAGKLISCLAAIQSAEPARVKD